MNRTDGKTPTRIAIVGGGKACRELLQMVQADPGHLAVEVAAVAEPFADSPGVTLARQLGIPVVPDYRELVGRADVEIVVELTGRPEVRDDLRRLLPAGIHLIDHQSSRFFWDFLALSQESVRLRAHGEERILAERNRLRHILDSLPYEILVIGKDYTVELANRTFLEANDLTLEQVVGHYCYDIEHRTKAPCEVSVLGCPHAESLQAGEAVATIVSQTDADGQERFAAVRAAPIRDDEGHVLGVIEAIRDITPRMQMEEQLRRTRARLNLFIDSAPLFIYMKDEALRYKVINRHALETLGVEEATVLGHTDRELYPEEAAARIEAAERRALRTGKAVRGEGVLPVAGREMHYSATYFPVLQDGKAIGLFGLIEDVTELHASAEELHRKEAQLIETRLYLQGILENSRDMIFLTDLEGKLLSFNPGAERILGFPHEAVVGMAAERLLESPDLYRQLHAAALSEGHASAYEAAFRSREGDKVVCNVSLTRVDDPQGRPLEIIGMCRDLTIRLRLREDLIRSERLAAIGKMAAGVAHEINNPLAVIETIAGVLADTCADEDCVRQECRQVMQHAVERLNIQVRRATTITHSLLGLVRRTGGGRQALDLPALLDDTIGLLGSELGLARVEIERDYAPDLPQPRTDPLLLQQVLVNLLKNAVDAIEETGRGNGHIRLRARRHEGQIELRIEDDGVGIPTEAIGKIFDLFHTSKPAGKGTGLGLAIVHDIVERLGGEISVDSEVGRWTRFTLRLPLEPPPAPPGPPTPSDPAPAGPSSTA